ncbi:MAG: hypothetical protein ABJE95_23960 [Byssovorax sp.]
MRLDILDHGHRPVQKLFLGIIALLAGRRPGPIWVMSYRSELFGKAFSACLQEAMGKSTEWSVGEVEVFAAFVSKQNQCVY